MFRINNLVKKCKIQYFDFRGNEIVIGIDDSKLHFVRYDNLFCLNHLTYDNEDIVMLYKNMFEDAKFILDDLDGNNIYCTHIDVNKQTITYVTMECII